MEINCSKTQATLFSLSAVKERVTLKMESMSVPQVDNPAFLVVKVDPRLTWKTHWETASARSLRKLRAFKELACRTWAVDINMVPQWIPAH